MSADSNRRASRRKSPKKLQKPRPEFPTGNSQGHWCKKKKGHVCCFGKVADDPKGIAAEEKYVAEDDDRFIDLLPGKSSSPIDLNRLDVESLDQQRVQGRHYQ